MTPSSVTLYFETTERSRRGTIQHFAFFAEFGIVAGTGKSESFSDQFTVQARCVHLLLRMSRSSGIVRFADDISAKTAGCPFPAVDLYA